ncbi:hypothetical protein KY339_06025, partial [Candidatus Woesearchaeota archaeon]|nr:hypothetical protein [Candidatus Woesearchaeota archaeon]
MDWGPMMPPLPPTTTDDSVNNIRFWYIDNATITLNATDPNGDFNATLYCNQSVYAAQCNPNLGNVSLNNLTSVNLTCNPNSVCQLRLRYYSNDLAGNNETPVKQSHQINIVVDSYINDSYLNNTQVQNGSHIVNSSLFNSTVDGCTVIDSVIINSNLKYNDTYVHDCRIINSTIIDSNITNGEITDSYIDPSVVIDSVIINSNISNSTILFSYIQDTVFCTGFYVFNAGIDDGILTSGRIVYNSSSYYAPFNLDNICALIAPRPVGNFYTSPGIVSYSDTIAFVYEGPATGYNVTVNASPLKNVVLTLTDPDYDGVYTASIAAASNGTGTVTIWAFIDDMVGNQFNLSTEVTLEQNITMPFAVRDEGDWTNDNDSLYAEWSSTEFENYPGFIIYKYRIKNSTNEIIRNWTNVGTVTWVAATGLNLTENETYTFIVQAYDSIGNRIKAARSDGIRTDFTEPGLTNITSSTHPVQTQFYNSTTANFTIYAVDNLSGVEGYSYILDSHPGTMPDQIMDTEQEEELSDFANDGFATVIKENATGSTWSVFSETAGNITSGDNVTVELQLFEDIGGTFDLMQFKVYLVDNSTLITGWDHTGNNISNVVTRNLDIDYADNPQDASIYSVTLTSTSTTDGFYVVVTGVVADDNRNNLSIAGSLTDIDNSTRVYVCQQGGSCDDNTTTIDYAIKVTAFDNSTNRTITYTNLDSGTYWFHVIAKDKADNWNNPSHYKINIDAVPGAPQITYISPVGITATTSPRLIVETNEDADCYYNSSASSWSLMFSINGTRHESQLSG